MKRAPLGRLATYLNDTVLVEDSVVLANKFLDDVYIRAGRVVVVLGGGRGAIVVNGGTGGAAAAGEGEDDG